MKKKGSKMKKLIENLIEILKIIMVIVVNEAGKNALQASLISCWDRYFLPIATMATKLKDPKERLMWMLWVAKAFCASHHYDMYKRILREVVKEKLSQYIEVSEEMIKEIEATPEINLIDLTSPLNLKWLESQEIKEDLKVN